MEISSDKIEDLIARRLLTQAEEAMKQSPTSQTKPTRKTPVRRKSEALVRPDFIKLEKNLVSLGFFTPSSRRIKNEKSKTIVFTRFVDGNRVEAKVTVVPAALFGLPVTADQDKYFAFQKLVTDVFQQEGRVANPIGFSSSELLHLLNQADAGKNYQDVSEWLDLMTATTIISEGAVYLAGKKVHAKDRFHIFDRAVSVGKEIEPGVIADKNYVWLSDWQLENINNNYLLPTDFAAYTRLKNHIAKALVPLLQVWLFATRGQGRFEKRYGEICQILAIREYRHLSEIKRNFSPSLDELKAHGYISGWKIEKTSDRKSYKVIFLHGDKFQRDLNPKLHKADSTEPELLALADSGQNAEPEEGGAPDDTAGVLLALTKRGIAKTTARRLLASLADSQQVLDQLEWGDHLVSQAPGNFRNPPGFYIHLLKENITVPEDFETSRKRRLREESRTKRAREEHERMKQEQAYNEYLSGEVDRYIAAEQRRLEFEELAEAQRAKLLANHKYTRTWPAETLTRLAQNAARSEILNSRITPLSFEQFCDDPRYGHLRSAAFAGDEADNLPKADKVSPAA